MNLDNQPNTKLNTKSLQTIIVVATGVILGFGAINYASRDHSLYGRKENFPSTFYGKRIHPDNLNPSLKESYFRGYANDDLIIKVLEGQIINSEPIKPSRTY